MRTGIIPEWTIGDRLRKARQVTGLEQTEFADEIGVSRGTVRNYELGTTTRVKPIVLRAWALRSGVPLEWIVNGESPRPREEAGGSGGLPRLDLNQRPSVYPFSQVTCDVTPLRKASRMGRGRRSELLRRRRHDELGAAA